jgi:hypothetical protein
MADDTDQLRQKYSLCEILQNSEASQPNIIRTMRIVGIDVAD